MHMPTIEQYGSTIRMMSETDLQNATVLQSRFLIASEGSLSICYAPFEYVNERARVVIVGITPGKTQMINALREARTQLCLGSDFSTVLRVAKQSGAFSGAMRPNLVAMLDRIGLNGWLHIDSCARLFGSGQAHHMVQTASALTNPVFVNGENYNGTPNMTRHRLLQHHLMTGFGQMAKSLRDAVFVPLGDKVAEALEFLAAHGVLDRERVLAGLPHPSGANAERINYFLGRKDRASLSAKTDPQKLDRAREQLIARVAALA